MISLAEAEAQMVATLILTAQAQQGLYQIAHSTVV